MMPGIRLASDGEGSGLGAWPVSHNGAFSQVSTHPGMHINSKTSEFTW